MDYKNETTKKLKFLLWANLQDNMNRSEIIDKSKSEEHKQLVMQNILKTEKEIAAIRNELKARGM